MRRFLILFSLGLLILAGLLSATRAVAQTDAVPVVGSPGPDVTASVLAGLATFTPAQRARLDAVVFADAGLHGRLRTTGPGEFHVINAPSRPDAIICGEPWTFLGMNWLVIVADPRCGDYEGTAIHEMCHFVVGLGHGHDHVWSACNDAHATAAGVPPA